MAIPTDERKSKAELIQELESVRAQLTSNTAAQQLAVIQEIEKTLADEHDLDAIYTAVGNKLMEIFDAEVIGFYEADLINQKMHFPWSNERGLADRPEPVPLNSMYRYTIEQGGTFLINEGFEELAASFEDYKIPHGLAPKSVVAVPVITRKDRWLTISLQDMEKERAFSPEDIRLLEILAATMGTALENARLFEETKRRNAELAIINSVQEGLASKLDIQSIIELVGEKVREIFQADTTIIATYEYDTEKAHYRYVAEKGDRFDGILVPFNGFHREMIRTRKTILFNENLVEQVKPLGFEESLTPHDLPKSALNVPLVAGGDLIGHVALEDLENEHAFSESDVSLLETLANSMSVALDNARLFDETQSRNAELAVINSVQEGLAAELEFQGIIDLVGDKLRDVLKTEDIGIRIYDRENDHLHFYYEYEHGERIQIPSGQPGGLSKLILESMKSLYGPVAQLEQLHSIDTLPGTDESVALLAVPIMKGTHPIGLIRVEDFQDENAFSESDVRLLETLANSMSVALENARLFEETQSRNAELAVINSVQTALAAELDLQGIYDLVGDKIQEIFSAQAVIIGSFDHEKGLQQANYFFEKGEHEYPPPVAITGLMKHIIETGETLVFNENAGAETEKYGSITLGEEPRSAIFVPLKVGSKVTGAISLQDVERDHVYQESDVRLLETLANSMSVAIENARLFEETNQRNAELAIINTVQEGLAAELDMRGIYQLVGDKIGEITGANVVLISSWDWDAEKVHIDYARNYGEYLDVFNRPFSQLHREVFPELEKGKTLVWNEKVHEIYERTDHVIAAGEIPKTIVGVPFRIGGKIKAFVSIQDFEQEFAFDQETIRLVETLTANMEIALENARLFEETQARNAELAVINSVQEGLASQLDMQAIYELVGDKFGEITGAEVVMIGTMKWDEDIFRAEYFRDGNQTIHGFERPVSAFHLSVRESMEAGETQVLNQGIEDLYKQLDHVVAAGEMPKTMIAVPMRVGREYTGFVSLQDTEREFAFDESTIRLVETLTRNMEIALENARLFEETQARNAELAVINSVQQGLASKLDMQAIYDLVGDKVSEITGSEIVVINTWDTETGMARFEYIREKGERFGLIEREMTPLNWHLVPQLEAGNTFIQNENVAELLESFGHSLPAGEMPKTVVSIPLKTGGKVDTSISLQDTQREHAFDESTIRLVETLARSMGIALENARLFDAVQRSNKEIAEALGRETASNDILRVIAESPADIQPVLDAIAESAAQLSNSEDVIISLADDETLWVNSHYGDIPMIPVGEGTPLNEDTVAGRAILQRQSLQAVHHLDGEETEFSQGDRVAAKYGYRMTCAVPMIRENKAIGTITIRRMRPELLNEQQIRLIESFANQAAIAVENVRLFNETERLLVETEQRNQELAIISTISQALTQELDLHSLIDLVGDKIRNAVQAENIGIGLYDKSTNLLTSIYVYRSGKRVQLEPIELSPYNLRFAKDGKSLVLNAVTDKVWNKVGSNLTYGDEIPKSVVLTPILAGGELIGGITLQDFTKENAYPESQVRLLETIASNMSAAMQNARLFEETQHLLKETEGRNAELALINSVQKGLAAELDFQGIIDLVGDKLREVLDTKNIGIRWYDYDTQLVNFLYEYEHGERLNFPPVPSSLGWEMITSQREPHVYNTAEEVLAMGTIPGTDTSKSIVRVPIIGSDRVLGSIVVENHEREYAFSASDVRMVATVASSMGVALENARLFDETQRLLKETEERNAELAVINSVQEGLASKLEMQAIYDLVGDKLREIFKADTCFIAFHDEDRTTVTAPYYADKSSKGLVSRPYGKGIYEPIVESGNPVVFGSAEETKQIGRYDVASPGASKDLNESVLGVPIFKDGKAIGAATIQSYQKNAYTQGDLRLLQTLTNSMSVALESARLFDETQRLLKETEERNAELAVINSVQEGLAAELDFQGIVDLVGDTLREVLDTGDIGIRIYDPGENVLHFPYELEHGERLAIPSNQPTGLSKKILETSKPHFGPTMKLKEEFQMSAIPGTDESKAVLAVPIITGDSPRGLIVVEDFTDEHAYTETDVRLMETLANSMSVALENARLFEELQNSNREISAALERQTATGDILQIMANSPGEIQPVLAAVAEHAAKLVEADDVQIYQADDVKLVQMAHYGPLPALQDGESLPLDVGLATGRAVLERRTIQVDAGNLSEEEYPISVQLQKRLKHRSVIMTPLVREGNAVGAIVARRNEVREFSVIQVDLLRTFANQAAIAIENVRLFEETKRLLSESMQQAEELKTVNTVSTALSSELELDGLIELIGSQVQKIFSADIAYVGLLDKETNMIKFPYSYGEETRPLQMGEGLTSRVIQEGQPVLINQDEEWSKTQGRIGVKSKSYLGVPISAGKDVIGVISVQSTEWTNMYGQKEVRLLSTIAANVGAAISNANLFSEVERQKVYFEALISSAPVAIVTIDLDGNVSGWSPAAEELYGYTPEEAIGRNIDDLVANDPSIREEAENYTNLNLEQPGPNQIQLKTQRTHKDGRLIDVTVSAMPVYIEGERRGYIAIYNDISQLEKARRDAEEANHAKSAFLANMSHELRTPLNAIIGFTRIVKRKGEEILPEKQIDNLDKVLVSAEHLLGLINTVLDISKIEAGRMDIHVSTFDLKPLIDLVMVTAQPLIKQDMVELVSDVAEGLPMVQSDLEKIKQILINLLSNAAKFTHEGEIKVSVREVDQYVQVAVSDTGIGISAGAAERIFEEFQQADVSTTREYGGTGLGLSISRSLARLLGGDLIVESEPGRGSTFTLTFPVNLHQREEVQQEQEQAVASGAGGHLILVIDDNEDAIYLMRENLESAGYQVAVARNGEEGLAMARELLPFAITLDIMMPKKDGWQVLHDLKQNPETRSIPVIMISIVDKKALGYRLGAADYLVKPLNEEQVLVSLGNLKKENGDKPLKRLLVVDDDPNIADMVRQLLEDSHYQIEEARDGQDALEQIEANPPDAILLDLMMPRLDGLGLIEILKQSEQFADLPIIILTAKLLSEGDRNALSESVGKVIQKQGLSGEALLAEITNSIRTRI